MQAVIENMPFIRLHHTPDPSNAEIRVKWEGVNPTGSMKD